MSDIPEQHEPRMERARLHRWGPAIVLLLGFVIVSVVVGPQMKADGSARVTTYDLDAAQTTPGLRVSGNLDQNVYGFVVPGFSTGRASFAFSASSPGEGERTVLFVTAGAGPAVSIRLNLVDSSGVRHQLGSPTRWVSRRVDVTTLVQGGEARLEFAATNNVSTAQLVADQVRVATYTSTAIPRASRWEVAAWVALAMLFALVALRRLRQDGMLVAAAGLTAFLVWPAVTSGALQPLFGDLWDPAIDAKWLDLDRGLLSGTFGPRSSLAVQLFHVTTPVTGTGVAGARTASMLVGIVAVIAIYALGRRVAGPVGAAAAVTCSLLADPFRLSLSTGDSTGTLVLAACIFLVAVHRALLRGNREAMILLGAGGALAILAEPTWWPGVLAAIVLLALRCSPKGTGRRALATALLAIALVSLPSRVSVAHQSSGDVNADVIQRATTARNAEFVGRGHGAPPDREALAAAPTAGRKVGLAAYMFGDHSVSVVLGGMLSGGYDSLSAAAERPETKLVGLIAFIVGLVGAVFLLLLPKLRLLVLIPAMVALVPWFFASRDPVPSFAAGTAFWPALLVGAAAAAYAAREAARQRIGTPRLAGTVLARPIARVGRLGRRGPARN